MTLRPIALSFLTLVLAACTGVGKQGTDSEASSTVVAAPAPSVTLIELGRQSGGNSLRVTEPSDSFKARDTVFLAVVTANAASDTELTARWSFSDGTVVDSSAQSVARESGTARAVTQFRMSREKGWSVGAYTVDVWMNDRLIGTKRFDVMR